MGRYLSELLSLLICTFAFVSSAEAQDTQAQVATAAAKRRLEPMLHRQGLTWGSRVFLRTFKASKEIEVWIAKDNQYVLFRTYPICYFSGSLGPKKKQGDGQAPEGFYKIQRSSLNPNSAYHLSMNVGYPNAYDRAHGYTGGWIMIHGDCVSIGCLAITDKGIEDVYALVEASLKNDPTGVPVHIFPFRMSWVNMWRYQRYKAFSFWRKLRPGYAHFEDTHVPPQVTVQNGEYVFSGHSIF